MEQMPRVKCQYPLEAAALSKVKQSHGDWGLLYY